MDYFLYFNWSPHTLFSLKVYWFLYGAALKLYFTSYVVIKMERQSHLWNSALHILKTSTWTTFYSAESGQLTSCRPFIRAVYALKLHENNLSRQQRVMYVRQRYYRQYFKYVFVDNTVRQGRSLSVCQYIYIGHSLNVVTYYFTNFEADNSCCL